MPPPKKKFSQIYAYAAGAKTRKLSRCAWCTSWLRLRYNCSRDVIPPIRPTRPLVTPPLVEVAVPHGGLVIVVQHRAQPTPELGVDELARSFPREVLAIQLVGLVEAVEVFSEIFGRRKILDVDVRVRRSGS